MQPNEILTEQADLYEQKNADYGNSFENFGHAMFQAVGRQSVTLDSPDDWNRIQLYVFRMTKLLRSFNGEFLADELNFEAVYDSHGDEAVYAAMAAYLAAQGDAQQPEEDAEEVVYERTGVMYDDDYIWAGSPAVQTETEFDPERDAPTEGDETGNHPAYEATYQDLTGNPTDE